MQVMVWTGGRGPYAPPWQRVAQLLLPSKEIKDQKKLVANQVKELGTEDPPEGYGHGGDGGEAAAAEQ